MNLRSWPANSMVLALFLGLFTRSVYSASRPDSALRNHVVMSRAEYLDRAKAIWTAQMIGQMTGMLFEHKPASVLVEYAAGSAQGLRTGR